MLQTPSTHASKDEEKYSTMQVATKLTSPMGTPARTSLGRQSQDLSASVIQGVYRSGSGNRRKSNLKRAEKGGPDCGVVEDEYDCYGYTRPLLRRCQVFLGLLGLFMLSTSIFMIKWCSNRPDQTSVTVKNLTVHEFYLEEGRDPTGSVPVKMLTMNCSVTMDVFNMDTKFGIFVSSMPVFLMHSTTVVATGELTEYSQESKTRKTMSVNLVGRKTSVCACLGASNETLGLPFTLLFQFGSRVMIGPLWTEPKKEHPPVSCSVVIDSDNVVSPVNVNLGQRQCKYNVTEDEITRYGFRDLESGDRGYLQF